VLPLYYIILYSHDDFASKMLQGLNVAAASIILDFAVEEQFESGVAVVVPSWMWVGQIRVGKQLRARRGR